MCMLEDPGGWANDDAGDHVALLKRRTQALLMQREFNRANEERSIQFAKKKLATFLGVPEEEVQSIFGAELETVDLPS